MSEKAVEDLNQSVHELHESPITPGGTLALAEEPPKSIREILLQMKLIQEESSRDHLSQMRQLLAQEEIGANLTTRPFDWMTCKPGKLFHPVSIGDNLSSRIRQITLFFFRNGGFNH
jgi:hypothetical protein